MTRYIEDGEDIYISVGDKTPSDTVTIDCPFCKSKQVIHVDKTKLYIKDGLVFSLVTQELITTSDQHSQRNFVLCPICYSAFKLEEFEDVEYGKS